MNIDECIKELLPQIKIDKDFFWNHPEEEFNEIETSNYIIKRLKEMGYTNIKTNIAKTGIVAELSGNEEGECILFRADMDAVVMDENHRVKHTCGHDSHMSILLSVAQILINNKDKIKGHVKLLFQPAEEGSGGAEPMISEGVLTNPDVDKVFALHVWSEIEQGKIGIKEGPVMASTNPFKISVIGKGGHVAIPEKCINPIYVANRIISEIEKISDENYDPNEKIVLGITAVNGGSTNNVIPDKIEIKGACRTYNNDLEAKIWNRINKISESIAKSMNAKVEIESILNFPAVLNSKSEAEDVAEIAKKIVGEENIVTDYKSMCSEDFSFFLQKKPGAFVLIGNKGENLAPQHNENYFVSDTSIIIGAQLMYEIAKKYLKF